MSEVPQLALIVEDDQLQREILSDLLTSENMDVIQCESAEAGELVLALVGLELSVMVTDVALAGAKNGLELAQSALERFPHLKVVIVSGQDGLVIPPGACWLRKPWQPLDMLRETAR
ncbi:response regulator [Bradyrhizobium sp. LHD-71]|uniref:response regulator n=1 Tax=Bradyrhizobium sp. LHD-71 TaxID=3072141 RepID=UPI00280FF749|nr:response regulator [Bradyrhizobium sp. LHD-71]MDQ8729479.1 response regulator [Bradyrhizobium sp. LHD-71]